MTNKWLLYRNKDRWRMHLQHAEASTSIYLTHPQAERLIEELKLQPERDGDGLVWYGKSTESLNIQ